MVGRGVSAQEFGPKLNRTAGDVIEFLLQHGEMLTVTMGLSDEHMELYALDLGADLLLVDPGRQKRSSCRRCSTTATTTTRRCSSRARR